MDVSYLSLEVYRIDCFDKGISSMKQNRELTEPSLSTKSRGYFSGGESSALERWLLQRLLRAVGNPPLRVRLWDGKQIGMDGGREQASATIRNRDTLWRIIRNPWLHFGEEYSSGRLEVEPDLLTFMDVFHRANVDSPSRWRTHRSRRRNTLSGSRKNIHHHYDLGNDFYSLWLDEEMAYTCAYFPDPDLTLEQAQAAKMEHVCRKLDLRPGETVVEAGFGWGGLARHMARHWGVRVRAFNISDEQVRYARERAKREGLDDRIDYVQDDYRNITGKYDAFVSVGMLEHVGVEHYRELGNVVERSLGKNGRGLIHTIGQNRPAAVTAWVDKHIFPGAYPPALREMMDILEPYNFSVLDVENLRLHYWKTLEHWLARYEDNIDKVRQMFDEEFVRAWRLYLAASATSFRAGKLQLFQVLFAPAANNNMPWTRDHLYRTEKAQ